MTTRGRPPGQPKSGGRQVGAKNKVQVTEQMRGDILTVYAALGGVVFLLDWAQNNQTEFIKQCWARIAPPMPRDDPEPVNQSLTINASNMSDYEAAKRIAFALAKGAQMLEVQQTIEQWLPSLDTVRVTAPVLETPDPALAQWASSLNFSEEQRRDQAVVRETSKGSLETYPGSAAEQGYRRERLL